MHLGFALLSPPNHISISRMTYEVVLYSWVAYTWHSLALSSNARELSQVIAPCRCYIDAEGSIVKGTGPYQ